MELNMSDILRMQRELRRLHRDDWGELTPERGAEQLLWAIGEMGELVDIVKKKGAQAIMASDAVRAAFTEEFSDVLMYMGDIMLCYGIDADEIARAYRAKHELNMHRVYEGVTHYEKENGDE